MIFLTARPELPGPSKAYTRSHPPHHQAIARKAPMPPFPHEVIERVVRYNKDDIRVLETFTLVSKSTQQLAHKYLFASLDWSNSMDRIRARSFRRFVTFIRRYPYIPSFVISLKIAFGCFPRYHHEPEHHLESIPDLPRVLSTLINLRCITIQGVVSKLVTSGMGLGVNFGELPEEVQAGLIRVVKGPRIRAVNFKHVHHLPIRAFLEDSTFVHLGLVRCQCLPPEIDPRVKPQRDSRREIQGGRPPMQGSGAIRSLTLSTRDARTFWLLYGENEQSGTRSALLNIRHLRSVTVLSSMSRDCEWKTEVWTELGGRLGATLENITLYPSRDGLTGMFITTMIAVANDIFAETNVLDDSILDLGRHPALRTLYWHSGTSPGSDIHFLTPLIATLRSARRDNLLEKLFFNFLYQNLSLHRYGYEDGSAWPELDALLVNNFPLLGSVEIYIPDTFPVRFLSTRLPQAWRRGLLLPVVGHERSLTFNPDTVF